MSNNPHAHPQPDDATAVEDERQTKQEAHHVRTSPVIPTDPTLSPKAKILYQHLLACRSTDEQEGCCPSQATLATDTGYSRRTVIRALQELQERGKLTCVRRGLGNTNRYILTPAS